MGEMHDLLFQVEEALKNNDDNNTPKILTHQKIVDDISYECLKKTNHLILVACIFTAVFFLLLLLIKPYLSPLALIIILAAKLYKSHYSKKLRKANTGSYRLLKAVCVDKDIYKQSDENGSLGTIYTLVFDTSDVYRINGYANVFSSVEKGDECYLLMLVDDANVECVYRCEDWSISPEIIEKVEIYNPMELL